MKRNSIRFQASILYTSVLCGILVVYSGVLFSVTRHILYRDVDDRLRMKSEEIVHILKSYQKLQKTQTPEQHLINRLLGIEDRARLIVDDLWRANMKAFNLADDYINILDARGLPVIRSRNFNDALDALFREQLPFSTDYILFMDIRHAGGPLRAVSLPFAYNDRHLLVIQIATPLDAVTRILNRLLYFIAGGILFILALTSFLGAFFTRRILKPVAAVTRIADDISHTDLNLRIPETATDDEMQGLIRSLNAMIGRLETAFAHINQFSSHVAHELKTPLAIVKGELELALQGPRTPEEYERVIGVSLEEIDRLTQIIKDLLLLARLDYSTEVFTFEALDLGAFLLEVRDQSDILAQAKGLEVTLDIPAGKIFVRADKAQLRRLFLNLIHNAVKFTPPKGRIHLILKVADGLAHVTVSDTGRGIPTQDRERIFEPFFHTRPDGTDAEPGSGLGLPIARSIARAHKGGLRAENQEGKGAAFRVWLPLALISTPANPLTKGDPLIVAN